MQQRVRTIFLIILTLIFLCGFTVHGQENLIDDLRSKIAERNKVIADLEKEIVAYQAEAEKTSTEARTLKTSIDSLERTRKKLSLDIRYLEEKISLTTLTIQDLGTQIGEKEAQIERVQNGIRTTLARVHETESSSLLEIVLAHKTISTFWDQVGALGELTVGLQKKMADVRVLKADLEQKQTLATGKRKELVTLASELSDQKKVAEYNKLQTAKLLDETQNKESNYRKLIKAKQALRDAFAQELADYEAQLKFAIDPNSLPTTGSGVLKWPLAVVKITQQFGDTDFARAHAQAYNGHGHNGIDLKASIGTKVMAALSGKVIGTGNTDASCPNASYGKWVLLQHDNGLSTLYAHLSVIKVTKGDLVATGDAVGYSGDTGYATGPHLHFTVYATQGVRVMSRQSKVCNASYVMPVASFNAYLNPLLYL